jgi:surfeit locus 1 family protein
MSTRGRTIVFGLLTAATAAVCVRLGLWQLDRLSQRRAQNAIVTSRGAQPALSLAALQGQDTSVTHWRRVTVRGVADYSKELVHATRSQNGSPGVYLLTPVRPVDGSWGDTAIIVLRGYVYAPDGRTVDFAKAREADTLQLDALLTSFPPPKPGQAVMRSSPRAMRLLDRDTMATLIGRPVAPFILLALGDTIMQDITRPVRVPPPPVTDGPHFSYALQWFGFASVFVVGFVLFSRGRPRRGMA